MIGRFARYLFGRDAEDELPPVNLAPGSSVESLEAVLGEVPPRLNLPLPRWLGPLAICCLVGFLPWIVYLGLTLPRRSRADHYDLAWIGFDGAMWLVLAALGWVALKRHPATGPVAAVASTMLVVDAWFDVTTSSSGGQFVMALVLALGAEIPLAIVCAWAAINAERIRARAHRRLHVRWQNAIGLMRQAASERAATVSPSPPAPPQR